jgi:Ca-activated chloride channel homolog
MPVQMHPETAVGELKAGSYAFPLQAVDVRGTIRGLLYSATITQKFRNERDTRMEAVYVFPLPAKAAVHNFVLKIGDRVIEGEIKERGAARREYQAAVQAGHRAALMEEERSDIFTTTVGNIGPGEEVEIKFELSGPLSCFKNTARLRLPLVVGEVYIPGRALAGASVGEGVEADTDQVPDASRITPPRLADGVPNPVALSVSFMVEPSGLTLSDVASTCHFARTKRFEDGRYRVSLLPGVEKMDKAFVLEVTYPENTLQTSLLVDEKQNAFALTVVPPVARERKGHPRDVIILLDRSGSMQGWPMIAARRATARIIESLNQEDRFGVVAYDTSNDHFDFKNGLCHANNFYKMRAAEWLSKIDARGGTEMLPALRDGLSYFRQMENRDPHIILVTDGDVGNDSALIRSCQTGIRISTIGIGYAAREGLLNRMAETSGGLCTLIPNESDLESELVEMHRKWGQPIWKGLTLRGADDKFKSPKFWDVWQDVPTTFFGRLDQLGERTEVSGWFQGKGQYSEELRAIPTEDPVVYRAWARSRLLDLEDLFLVSKASPAELVELSVSAQVLCRFTAFTAIDKSETVDTEEKLQQVVQPVEQTIQRSKKRALSTPAQSTRLGKPMLNSSPGLRGRSAPPSGAPPMPCSMPAPEPMFDCQPEAEAVDCFSLCEMAPEAPMAELFCEDADDAGWLGGEMKKDVTDCLEMTPLQAEAPMLRSSPLPAPKPILSAKQEAASVSRERQLKDLLEQDPLLNLGQAPSPAAVQSCLDKITELIAQLTVALRDGKLQHIDNWKEALSKLLDYQEALEELLSGSGLQEARSLRKEIAAMFSNL